MTEKRTFPWRGITGLVAGVVLLSSCASAKYLRTVQTRPAEITGTYTLILYGARFSDDRETVAVLDKEGDRFEFEMYAADFDYRVKRNLPAREALEEAEGHVSFHHSFQRSLLSGIVDYEGKTIGYEMRPLYAPLDLGYSDILDIAYYIRDDKVIVRVRLRPELERRIFDEDGPLIFRHGR